MRHIANDHFSELDSVSIVEVFDPSSFVQVSCGKRQCLNAFGKWSVSGDYELVTRMFEIVSIGPVGVKIIVKCFELTSKKNVKLTARV